MFHINVAQQVLTILLSIVLGAFLCVCFDILRYLHIKILKGFFEVLISDLLFWIFAALVTFCFLIIRCSGQVRLFVLFGILIGFFLFRFLLSRFIFKILGIIGYVLTSIYSVYNRIITKIRKYIEIYFKKVENVLKKDLKHKAELLYNHLKVSKRNKDSHC